MNVRGTARGRLTTKGWRLLSVVLVVVAVAGCSDDGDAAPPEEGTTAPSTAPTPEEETGVLSGEWETVAPDEAGMDADALEEARSYAFAEGTNTQGVVIVRGGEIVGEWYAEGADEGSWAASWSMAKSFTSALVGIAIAEGDIPGVDEPMTTWIPEWEGSDREAITLRHVLQMTAGLQWNEAYDPAAAATSDIIELVIGGEDQLAQVVDQPLAEEPGTVFNYSSGVTLLLSTVLEQATGQPVAEYAQEKLFGPIGMGPVDWWRDTAGNTLTYCCLDTTSRDYARFGLLYLHEGTWGDEEVVPSSWVAESLVTSEAAEEEGSPYGYQWWLAGDDDEVPADVFQASGHDGQSIIVVPSLDLVVVRNGTYVKDPGEPVADPTLFARYPPDGLIEGKGTLPPGDNWDEGDFLEMVIASITD